ncbi:AtpZ/AtpI family protein [Litoribacter ruber]|uniref:AtpZ/AtpI family protein n=1 Tax=Litoribacter ruber TaxID=702568 RepID=A0AAP2G568_9BACT|nr:MULTISPECIES: AtpZ/AtpI family protein [Litoribacter]MBS9524213.1 AtpZ/AtpI family protein [Litoribacter alkaliphilus]MBT0809989.1 AtpZ/AtpI family protein [Litoribacter ruber]
MNNPKKNSSSNNVPTYVKYIGLAFQMFGVIGLGVYVGLKVQERSQMKFPIWLLLFVFLSIGVAFYQLFLLIKADEREESRNKKP